MNEPNYHATDSQSVRDAKRDLWAVKEIEQSTYNKDVDNGVFPSGRIVLKAKGYLGVPIDLDIHYHSYHEVNRNKVTEIFRLLKELKEYELNTQEALNKF